MISCEAKLIKLIQKTPPYKLFVGLHHILVQHMDNFAKEKRTSASFRMPQKPIIIGQNMFDFHISDAKDDE